MPFDISVEVVGAEEAASLQTGRGRTRTSKWQKLYNTIDQLTKTIPEDEAESRLLKVTLGSAKEAASALSSMRYYVNTNHSNWRVTASRRGPVLYFKLIRDDAEELAEETEL